MTPDRASNALEQLAACRAAIARLGAREAAHYGELSDQAARLAGLVTTISRTLAEDTAALADAIVGLLEDEPRRVAMGAAARAVAIQRYSWADIARRLEGIYERAIAREGRRVA